LTPKLDNQDSLEMEDRDPLFPLFLRLAGRRVVLVGGGTVALAKHESLRAAQARVTVVAPAIDPGRRHPGTEIHERAFAPADLDGAWLAVAAATPDVNRAVRAAAEERRLFVNAVDDPETASAYAAAVVRRGPMTLAVSTGGGAPALAGLLREALEQVLPEDIESWLATARSLRARWRAEGVPMADRRPLLLQALNRLYPSGGRPA
jgi:uroporphyrin-III C-methyltransferase/precorrin-2 dehydrogenase/sirohydrochlorin ferrochelatase